MMKFRVDKRIDLEVLQKEIIKKHPESANFSYKTSNPNFNTVFLKTSATESELLEISNSFVLDEPEIKIEENSVTDMIKYRMPESLSFEFLKSEILKVFPDAHEFGTETGKREVITFRSSKANHQDVENIVSYLCDDIRKAEELKNRVTQSIKRSEVLETREEKSTSTSGDFGLIEKEIIRLLQEASEEVVKPKEEERSVRLQALIDEAKNKCEELAAWAQESIANVTKNFEDSISKKQQDLDEAITKVVSSAERQEQVINNKLQDIEKSLLARFDETEEKVKSEAKSTIEDIKREAQEFNDMVGDMNTVFGAFKTIADKRKV